MGTIDRIRYYDGEFLRAFDFNDEQSYHMEMRRRVNRYLHLYGIVQGLNLTSDTEAGVTQVSIMPGLAIDAFGREIYVFAPYTLGDNDITANRIATTGTYDVWLRYRKTASTPPSSGYSACNQANQYTRWVESFSIELLTTPSSPFTPPGFSDDDTDDPSQDQVAVLLGTVYIQPTSATATFSNPLFDTTRSMLLGVIAQRIQTPPGYDPTNPPSPQFQPFSFLNSPSGNPNTPLSPPVSLEIMPNIFADQNLIVGPDFPLTSTGSPSISITPAAMTPPTPSVKIAGDLFVQGNIYSPTTTSAVVQWNAVSQNVAQLVQSSMPDFLTVVTPVSVTNPATAGSPYMLTTSVILTSTKLSAMNSNVVASAALSGIQFNAGVTFAAASVGLVINAVSGAGGTPAANQCTVSVAYTVTGDFATGGSPSILSFGLTVTAICFPPST